MIIALYIANGEVTTTAWYGKDKDKVTEKVRCWYQDRINAMIKDGFYEGNESDNEPDGTFYSYYPNPATATFADIRNWLYDRPNQFDLVMLEAH